MNKKIDVTMAAVFLAFVAQAQDGDGTVSITGELKQWHNVTLTLNGPFAREIDTDPNPFTDYRFDVRFVHESGSPDYTVPGYFAADGDSMLYLSLTLYCLVMGSVTSYARARAESLGMDAKGGLAERADRLVLVLVATGLSAIFGFPWLLYAALWILAFANTATVVYRVEKVRKQAVAADAAAGDQGPTQNRSVG